MFRIFPAALLILILLPWAGNVAGQGYPNRSITLISPYPPGGAADLTARPLAPALERALKQSVVVVNRVGAGGAVGTQFVSTAPADGYTLMITVFSISTIPEADRVAGRKPRWSRDQFIPVARINADPTMVIVHPSTPWKSVKTLVADAKKRPNDIVFVSAGPYTVAHMAIEVFMQTAGIKMRHLPTTGGGPAMTALLGGHAFVSALSTGAVSPQAKAGKLRVLANTGNKRLAAFPGIPTLKEAGYDAEVYLWTGIFVRREVPPDVVKTLRAALRQAVQDPEFVGASSKMQMPPDYLDAPEFKTWWDKDSEMLARAIRAIPPVESK
jgi:tripartite-type tricarboxylate transporter receptor subunit TctC